MSTPYILVVDDEPAIRRTLRVNLTARGYHVVLAETGEEALAQVEAQMPSLVILDLMLPGGMSGLEICRALRAQSAVPILVLSARGEERSKVQALDLGADDYLTKPFGMDELLARIRALLRRPATTTVTGGIVQVDDIIVDTDRHQAINKGESSGLHSTARHLRGGTGFREGSETREPSDLLHGPYARAGPHCVLNVRCFSQIAVSNGPQVVVEFLHSGYSGGNFHFDNLCLGQVLELLYQCAQSVPMCHDQHKLS